MQGSQTAWQADSRSLMNAAETFACAAVAGRAPLTHRNLMRILLTNDDGIEAPGLDALQKIAADLSDDVWVVAPETDQSGAAHSLTLHEPLRLRKLSERVYAVKGTPTDCVIMAVRHVLKGEEPALVLSGVNRGAN